MVRFTTALGCVKCSSSWPVAAEAALVHPAGGARGGFGDREERRGFGDRDRDDRSQTSDDGPSRADTADDWGASRKFTPSAGSDRGGGYGDREPRRSGFGDRSSARPVSSCLTGSIFHSEDCRMNKSS